MKIKPIQNNDPSSWMYWLITLDMTTLGSIAKTVFDIINKKICWFKNSIMSTDYVNVCRCINDFIVYFASIWS